MVGESVLVLAGIVRGSAGINRLMPIPLELPLHKFGLASYQLDSNGRRGFPLLPIDAIWERAGDT